MKFLALLFCLIQMSYADVHDKFIADFDLKFTIGSCYVVPEEIKAQLKNATAFERQEAMLCLNPDKTLDRFGLMLFAVTKSSCHACTPETWIYDSSKPKSVYFLTEEIGSWGQAGTIEKVLVDKSRFIMVIKMIYAQMGEEIGSYFVVEFDKNKKESRILNRFFDSDHSFVGNEYSENCSGWKTILKTDPGIKVISFEKSGYLCDFKSKRGLRDGAKFSEKNKIKY